MTFTMTTQDHAHQSIPGYSPDLPVYEVWVNGRRYGSTQCIASARSLRDAMTNGRPAKVPAEIRIVNDRRSAAR